MVETALPSYCKRRMSWYGMTWCRVVSYGMYGLETVSIRVDQVANYETEFAQARDGQPPEEAEVERLKRHIDDIGETVNSRPPV